MDIHGIRRRLISDAIYVKYNPNGDPFQIKLIETLEDAKLLGMGVGLYWGEGNKANRLAVRLGNTDPVLIRNFIRFLVEICGIKKDDMKFYLQTFTDINTHEAPNYWIKELGVKGSQFNKVHVTISGSLGTYRHKSRYGVVTVYYGNKKLRDILVGMLPS